VRLSHGPRENANRPAVDPLFRSAAVAYGPRVVGVVLSGNLDDGSAGLAQIKEQGGMAVVQDPEEAMCSSMPRNALENTTVDHVLEAGKIGGMLVHLSKQALDEPQKREIADRIVKEAEMAEVDPDVVQLNDRPGSPSGFTCPECGGGLWETRDGKMVHFRCRTGHAYSIKSLLAEQSNTVEAALWSAMAALKEKSSLARRLAEQSRHRGQERVAVRFDKQADEADKDTEILRRVVLSFKNHVGEAEEGNGNGKSRRKQEDREHRSGECPPLPESAQHKRAG
jgi:two-component system chemotaxis response regulator CheB